MREELLTFLPLISTLLANTILQQLNDCGVDFLHHIGQGYIGASIMRAQAIIHEKYHEALYVYCSAHCFNLAVSSGCSIPFIRNCMAIMQKA